MSWLKQAGKKLSGGTKQIGGIVSKGLKDQVGGGVRSYKRSPVGQLGMAVQKPIDRMYKAVGLGGISPSGISEWMGTGPKSKGKSGGGGGAGAGGPGGPGGMPADPQYQGIANRDADGNYTQAGGTAVTASTIDADMSPWLKLQKEQQGREQMNLMNQAAQGAATGAAQARSSLASRGGLRGGAAERLAGASAENRLMGQQGVLNQGMMARGALDIAGEEMGREAQRFNATQTQAADTFNKGNLVGDIGKQNQFAMDRYGQQMAGWGAGQTSKAIKNSGKK